MTQHTHLTTPERAAQFPSSKRAPFTSTPAQRKRALRLMVERRVLAGLRQGDVADRLGVTREFYGQVERGHVALPQLRLPALAALLNVDALLLWPAVRCGRYAMRGRKKVSSREPT